MKKICVLSFLLLFLSSISLAGTINLPRTGQTKCWDTAGTEIPCKGTGQDGEIQAGIAWPEPRFTDNGDDTMTDNLTGLMWAKNANLPGGSKTWLDALHYCNNLTLAGHNDWRQPNVNELESLINVDESEPDAWLKTQGFINVQIDDHAIYWSSNTVTSNPKAAWILLVWHGGVYAENKVDDHYNPTFGYVWPVRAGQCGSFDSVICLPQTGQKKCYNSSGTEISCTGTGQDGEIRAGVAWPSPRFSASPDYVTDNLTSLMWTRNANLSNGQITWQKALDYVAGMNAGTYPNYGYSDWRLPNRKELHSLRDYSQSYPSLPPDNRFTNVQADGFVEYWSSSTEASTPVIAWKVGMSAGEVGDGNKSSNPDYVWPVRGGHTGPLGNLDISVNKTDLPDPVTVGNNLTYTIVVTNNGPETATGVTLTDTLPAGVIYVAATSTLGTCSRAGSTVTCNIGTLYNASSATVTIIVTPTTAGTITNTATVTCNETDTNKGNNTATATTTVNAGPTGCSTWTDVISKYNSYVSGQAMWNDVINCYNQYVFQ